MTTDSTHAAPPQPLEAVAPAPNALSPAHSADSRAGVLYALGAYGWWGIVGPWYFKLIADIPAPLILAHRIVWSMLVLGAMLLLVRRWREVIHAITARRTCAWLLVSTILLAINWLVFIYAVASNRLVEASFGYFINPIFTIILGMIFLGERLRRAQWSIVALALAGLIFLAAARGVGGGGLPWISIVLPISFGFYGLIRKQIDVKPLPGLYVEAALLTPLALIFLTFTHARTTNPDLNSAPAWLLLSLSGIVTTVPMIWFVAAARRLPLTTIGFLQFMTPTIQFLIAVLIFDEPFGVGEAVAFLLIWTAVGGYIADATLRAKAARASQGAVPE